MKSASCLRAPFKLVKGFHEMPAGKAALFGGVGRFGATLHNGVSIRSMRAHAKSDATSLTREQLKASRRSLRTAFKFYLASSAVLQKCPTATERVQTLTQMRNCAARFADASNFKARKNWADRLLRLLDGPDFGARAIIYRALSVAGRDLLKLKPGLQRAFILGEVSEDCLNAAHVIAKIDPPRIVEASRWRDPALVDLVLALAPIWRRVTGRSAGPVSIDRTGERKANFFAVWLNERLAVMGLPAPPERRISEIIRIEGAAKNENP